MLRILTEHPDAFKSVTISNTGLPTPKYKMPEAFIKWRNFSRKVDELPVSKIIQSSTMRHLDDQELVAYEAPFPDKEYQAGAKVFPSLVPIGEDPEGLENLKVWEKLSRLRTPFLCLFSDSDPITRGGEKPFQKSIPGADHPHHKILKNGGHFIQEDLPDEIVQNMLRFIAEI